MRRYGKLKRTILLVTLIVTLAFVYNEYLIYWHKLNKCAWKLQDDNNKNNLVKLMILSDTHLLGSRLGHWFDKLRREWQQYRSFQTARALLQPDYVVILGDITDEGKWCSDQEWSYYENRVKELFFTSPNDASNIGDLILVVGNHDIGFHYDIHEQKLERFDRSFHNRYLTLTAADKRSRKDIYFVAVNSMSMENDGCRFCARAQKELKQMNATLECLKKSSKNKCRTTSGQELVQRGHVYSRPIVFTHFPLYRTSDAGCPNDVDSELSTIGRNPTFRPKFDCLSLESTKQLIEELNPRAVFNGHTHYSCYNEKHGVPEYTIPSFSWRNINTPSMLLVQLDEQNHHVSKCFLPSESTVFAVYALAVVALLVVTTVSIFSKCLNKYMLLGLFVQRSKLN